MHGRTYALTTRTQAKEGGFPENANSKHLRAGGNPHQDALAYKHKHAQGTRVQKEKREKTAADGGFCAFLIPDAKEGSQKTHTFEGGRGFA